VPGLPGGGSTISGSAVVNEGSLEAQLSNLTIDAGVLNFGKLVANGADLVVKGAVTGNGAALIQGAGQIEFGDASSSSVTFASGASGDLKLDLSSGFIGTISGFTVPDSIDLADMGFGPTTTLSYKANKLNTAGVLTVTNGTHSALLAFLGKYTQSNFAIASDGTGGTLRADPPAGSNSGLAISSLALPAPALSPSSDTFAAFGTLADAFAPTTVPIGGDAMGHAYEGAFALLGPPAAPAFAASTFDQTLFSWTANQPQLGLMADQSYLGPPTTHYSRGDGLG
jgi:hypothetical protein